jgi:carboxypeptidase A4
MKFPSATLVVLAASSAFAKVSYNGAKAMRIAVGDDVIPLLDVISKLSLPTWKGIKNGVPVANTHVDLVVPADKVTEFEELTKGMDTEVMHADLGESIADEGRMSVYAGGYFPVHFWLQSKPYKALETTKLTS